MSVRQEIGPMLRLAAPLALTELGWMVMGIVDTIMAGRLNATAVGAGSLGNMLFYPIAICGTGVLLGMDTLVAQAFGAGDARECRRGLVNGKWLALAVTPVVCALLAATVPAMRVAGVNPAVFDQFAPYMRGLLWGVPALLLTAAFRRYLQAVNVVKPMLAAMVIANVLNALGDYALMFGHWGAPALGLAGSAYSTSVSRTVMAAIGAGAILWEERRDGWLLWRVSWLPDFARIWRLLRLGVPAALQILFEGLVFSLVTVWAARLDAASLAAHSIAVQVIATNFMIPLGIHSAAAVRVGQAMGRGDRNGAATAGWTALGISTVFMGSAALVMWTAPGAIVRLFVPDPAVIAIGAVLLRVSALFEIFDGFQTVATGALRGLGDTRSPMIVHLCGYWGVAVPAGYILCFRMHWGAAGIWVGLTAGLILIGAALLAAWAREVRRAAPISLERPEHA